MHYVKYITGQVFCKEFLKNMTRYFVFLHPKCFGKAQNIVKKWLKMGVFGFLKI